MKQFSRLAAGWVAIALATSLLPMMNRALAAPPERPSISIGDATSPEGNVGTVNATFVVTLSQSSNQTVTVTFATRDGTADAPDDYTSTSGTVTFAPGQTTQTISVPVRGDIVDEDDEIFFVNLSNASAAKISDPQGIGTIIDDDAPPTMSIGDSTVIEGDSGTVSAPFTVTLSLASGRTVTVDFATQDGTATAPSDYAETHGTLTFTPGQTTRTILVQVKGDMNVELDENFFVNLSNANNATVTDSQGVGIIKDNDTVPGPSKFSIGNGLPTGEGDTGTTTEVIFTVTRFGVIDESATVKFSTADGTATSPDDYLPQTGVLVFAPNELSKDISVQIVGDTRDEPDEKFFVNLSNPTNASIADPQGEETIIDDDFPPGLRISDATVTEGNTGVASAAFDVTLSPASGQNVTVQYSTADGSARAGSDYQSLSGQVTFSALQTKRTIVVPVFGDTSPEPDETFFVNLSNAVNAAIVDGQGVCTILDDDGQEFWFSWYDGLHQGVGGPPDWVTVANLGSSGAVARIRIPSPAQGSPVDTSRTLGGIQVWTQQFAGVMGGPVRVNLASSGIASIRSLWSSGSTQNFEEVSGVTDSSLTHYWPWYDGQSTGGQDWIHVVNPGAATADVTLKIADTTVKFSVPGGGNNFYNNRGLIGGPVVLTSTQPVLASQRVLWQGVNFSETPSQQTTTDTWFSWYDAVGSDGKDWIVIGNPGNAPVSATIAMPGMTFGPFPIAANSYFFKTFPGVVNGPVHVTATGQVVVSQRAIWGGWSFEEVPGATPGETGSLSWYDSVSTGGRDWVLVGNAGGSTASFTIKIAGSVVYCAGTAGFCGRTPDHAALGGGRDRHAEIFGRADRPGSRNRIERYSVDHQPSHALGSGSRLHRTSRLLVPKLALKRR